MDFYESKITLKNAVEKLPEDLKQIIKMNYYKDMTQRDIAKELNMSQMQVSRLLKRGLNQLYEILQSTHTAEQFTDPNSVDDIERNKK